MRAHSYGVILQSTRRARRRGPPFCFLSFSFPATGQVEQQHNNRQLPWFRTHWQSYSASHRQARAVGAAAATSGQASRPLVCMKDGETRFCRNPPATCRLCRLALGGGGGGAAANCSQLQPTATNCNQLQPDTTAKPSRPGRKGVRTRGARNKAGHGQGARSNAHRRGNSRRILLVSADGQHSHSDLLRT